MNRIRASRARLAAVRARAYRAWYVDPANGAIPAIDIITDRVLQRRELDRQLRRAQVGLFDTAAAISAPSTAPAR